MAKPERCKGSVPGCGQDPGAGRARLGTHVWQRRVPRSPPAHPAAACSPPAAAWLAATSTPLLLQERQVSRSDSDGKFPEPRVLHPRAAARLFARCSQVSGHFSQGRSVAGCSMLCSPGAAAAPCIPCAAPPLPVLSSPAPLQLPQIHPRMGDPDSHVRGLPAETIRL